MRMALLICTMSLLAGCATLDYTSSKTRLEVAECIATGWKGVSASGHTLPVSLTDFGDHHFVAVELHYYFSPLVTGAKHSTYAVWAEVRDSGPGSATEYHRAYQFTHERIDHVVVECQGSRQ